MLFFLISFASNVIILPIVLSSPYISLVTLILLVIRAHQYFICRPAEVAAARRRGREPGRRG